MNPYRDPSEVITYPEYDEIDMLMIDIDLETDQNKRLQLIAKLHLANIKSNDQHNETSSSSEG